VLCSGMRERAQGRVVVTERDVRGVGVVVHDSLGYIMEQIYVRTLLIEPCDPVLFRDPYVLVRHR
jgi:hypothetical protein